MHNISVGELRVTRDQRSYLVRNGKVGEGRVLTWYNRECWYKCSPSDVTHRHTHVYLLKTHTYNESCPQVASLNPTMYMHLTTKITHPAISQKCMICVTLVEKKICPIRVSSSVAERSWRYYELCACWCKENWFEGRKVVWTQKDVAIKNSIPSLKTAQSFGAFSWISCYRLCTSR